MTTFQGTAQPGSSANIEDAKPVAFVEIFKTHCRPDSDDLRGHMEAARASGQGVHLANLIDENGNASI